MRNGKYVGILRLDRGGRISMNVVKFALVANAQVYAHAVESNPDVRRVVSARSEEEAIDALSHSAFSIREEFENYFLHLPIPDKFFEPAERKRRAKARKK